MANSLSAIVPKVLAKAHQSLRKRTVLPLLVNTDYSNDPSFKGANIDVPLPVAMAAEDVTPAATGPDPADLTPTTVQIPLSNHKGAGFHLSDKDMQEIDAQQSFVPMQLQEAVSAIANAINADIMDEYKGVYGFAGAAGTTPFASSASEVIALRKVLNEQDCPPGDRRLVINADAEANALGLASISNFEQSGDATVKREGEIGRKYGFDWFYDSQVPTHTTGTLSDGSDHQALYNGGGNPQTVGAKTMNIDATSLTGTVVPGDIFTVAGDSQTYVVTNSSTLTASGNAITGITFEPGAKVAWADNAQVTFKDSHVSNMGFHRNALYFVSRPLAQEQMLRELGAKVFSLPDPQTGIVLRLELIRQRSRVVWYIDCLWGAKLVRRELAARMAG